MANASSDSTSNSDTISSFSNSVNTNLTIIQADKNFKIKAYPNPNNGILSIEFEQTTFESFELYLIDEQGKIVYSLKPVKESKTEINMSGFGKGVYILNILDTKNKNAFVNKIIYN